MVGTWAAPIVAIRLMLVFDFAVPVVVIAVPSSVPESSFGVEQQFVDVALWAIRAAVVAGLTVALFFSGVVGFDSADPSND